MSDYIGVDFSVVKKPGQERDLTQKEAREWIKCSTDPWYFFNTYCYVVGPKGLTLFEARDYQVEIIDTVIDSRFSIVNAPRQSGKSALIVLWILWETIFEKHVTSSLASYKWSGAKDLMARFKTTYENLPFFLKPAAKKYTTTEVAFTNGSEVFSQTISENTGRGRTITGSLVLDEHSFVNEHIARTAHKSYMPTLEAAGEDSTSKLIIISTPNGSSGLYAELAFGAMADKNGFKYLKVDPTKIPGRQSEEWRRSKIKDVGKFAFLQEYMGEFISNKGTLVSSIVLEAIETRKPIREYENLKIFVDSIKGRKLAIGVDVSEGIGQDNSSFQVFDINTFEQVAEYSDNMVNQSQYSKDILKALSLFKKEGASEMFLGIEKNGVGAGVLRLIENSEDPIMDDVIMINDVDEYGAPKGHNGLTTTNKAKMEACGQLKDLLETHRMTVYSEALLAELRFFVKVSSTFKAESGMTDDLVMATVIVMYMMKQLANYEDSVHDKINMIDQGNADDEVWGIVF